MFNLLRADVSSRIEFLIYRYRFLMKYTAIGVLSLFLEIVVYHGLEHLGWLDLAANMTGLAAGILFAYWLNVRFNFKVPRAKRNRALAYFVLISAGSAMINFIFKGQLQGMGWSYERARFLVAGSFFLLAYILHRKLSFSDYKKVGVAVYANGVEDIKGIYEKIGSFPDFIHIDVIDETFGQIPTAPVAYRLETIRAYWPRKPIHIHIMSRTPSRWIEAAAPYVDTIFTHAETDENTAHVLRTILGHKKRAGICLMAQTPIEAALPYAEDITDIMLLSITEPGVSGQELEMSVLDRIDNINQWKQRHHLHLCVDGGVNEKNITYLNVENIVSGSSVLDSPNPPQQIMRLQTSSNYERI